MEVGPNETIARFETESSQALTDSDIRKAKEYLRNVAPESTADDKVLEVVGTLLRRDRMMMNLLRGYLSGGKPVLSEKATEAEDSGVEPFEPSGMIVSKDESKTHVIEPPKIDLNPFAIKPIDVGAVLQKVKRYHRPNAGIMRNR